MREYITWLVALIGDLTREAAQRFLVLYIERGVQNLSLLVPSMHLTLLFCMCLGETMNTGCSNLEHSTVSVSVREASIQN